MSKRGLEGNRALLAGFEPRRLPRRPTRPQKGWLKGRGCEEPVVKTVARDQRKKTGEPEGHAAGGGEYGRVIFRPRKFVYTQKRWRQT